ncbi:MAG: TRAP transporter substrate-binding protein DctP [Deltaproteobacteria bacterium]
MTRTNCFVVSALAMMSFAGRPAAADELKHKLRIATAAPDGTAWANIFHRFANDVEKETKGEVEAKLYLNGIAGSEDEVFKRLEAGKLDGAVSGGPVCRRVMPSMRVLDVVGLFQNQEEATYVLGELNPALEAEAHEAGYELLTTGSLGPLVMFTRDPITSMAALQQTRLWAWDLNDVMLKEATALKLEIVATNLEEARKAFDDKRVDGFATTPVAALAFQWYVGTKYLTDLRLGYQMGCFVVRQSALDALPPDQQVIVRKNATKLGARIDADNKRSDQKLFGETYEHLGVKSSPVSKKFRAEFFEAARAGRKGLDESHLVPQDLLDKVTQMLADYRAEHN